MEGHVLEDEADLMGHRLDERELGLDERLRGPAAREGPRMKRPAQVLAELDRLAEASVLSVYFVDDNFIGNQKAELELLPHLVE